MNLQPAHQQELFELAQEMVNDLRCYVANTEDDGMELRHTKVLISRYEYLQGKIQKNIATLADINP
jgi:hypothetical protein